MTMIRPRLNDYHNLPLRQEDLDFAIPFLDEDIPLYVDPFLLWKISSQQDNALHTSVVNSFNQLGYLYVKGKEKEMKNLLIELSECNEAGLGISKNKRGKRIGEKLADEVLSLYKSVPQINKQGFHHFEEIQLLVDNISKDRISDIMCSLLKSFLIDFTIDQCQRIKLPIEKCSIPVYNYKIQKIQNEETYLPLNPGNRQPILLVPKRWLRYIPWLNYDDYFENYYIKDIQKAYNGKENRVQILNFNRNNYNLVQAYISYKELSSTSLSNDPLFTQIPIISAKRKVDSILKLPKGKTNNADKAYEDLMGQVLSSMLYPHLDFATEQSRTESGTQIRDLIFYNNRSYNFLMDLYDTLDCKQIVIELKNVEKIEREHINQLNRYLSEQFGRFGIIFTRNKIPKNILQNTIDLWSAHRKSIIVLDDSDLEMMSDLYETKQRLPLDVIKKKFTEFSRKCPS